MDVVKHAVFMPVTCNIQHAVTAENPLRAATARARGHVQSKNLKGMRLRMREFWSRQVPSLRKWREIWEIHRSSKLAMRLNV